MPHYRRMYAAARAITGNPDAAADAVQDAMVRIWRLGAGMATIGEPAAYAMAVVRRTAIDALRGMPPAATPTVETADAGEAPAEPDTLEFLERVIDTLPEGQRTVVRLSAFDDMSNDDIAELTGYSQGNVRQLLSRGRKRIKELYNKYMQP